MDQYTREQQLRHLQQQHRREALRQQQQQHPSHPSHAQQQPQQQQRTQSSQLPLNVFSNANVPSVPREALRPQSQQQPMHPGPPIQSALQQLPAPIPSQLSAVPLSDTPPMTMPQVPQQQQLQVLGSSEIGSIGSAELKQATRAMNAMGQAPLPPQAKDVMLVAGATRPAELQAKVLKFVEAYLKPIDVTRLADLLDKNVHELEFTYSEGEMLVRRQRMDFLTGSLQTGSRQTLRETFEGPVSYLQMYDFITTIDAVYQNIRGLQQHVDALPQLRDSREIEFLKTHLLPSDYRPWPFHENDTIRAKTLKNIPDSATQFQHFGAQDSGQGLRLGDKTRFVLQDEHDAKIVKMYEDVDLHKQLVRDPITGARAKTPFELCCDEAALLDYPVLNALVAISQGLFRVTLVKARQLVAYANYTLKDLVELQLGQQNWSEELKRKIDALDTVPGTIAQYSQFEIPVGSWINTFENSSVAVAGNRAKLQPKVTGLYNYPSNYLGTEYNRISGDSEGAQLHFGYRQPMPLHKLPSGGGAIGYHIVAKLSDQTWTVAAGKVAVDEKAAQKMEQERREKANQVQGGFQRIRDAFLFTMRPSTPDPPQQAVANAATLPASSVINVFTGPPPKIQGPLDNTPALEMKAAEQKIDYDTPSPDAPANIIITAKEHSLPEIHSVMELMRDHPIHACPRLAAALKQSGIHLLLLNEFLKVQCNFERELRQLRDTYISTSDPLAISQAVRSAPVWRECLRQADQELAAAEALKKN